MMSLYRALRLKVKIKKIFFDANIFNDIFDENRKHHLSSKRSLQYALENDIEVCTSCDIVTTIYYITSKYTSSQKALEALDTLKELVEIIPFAYKELSATIALMSEDKSYKDMEDTIQYILALQEGCDVIITNDKKFHAKEIKLFSSDTFMDKIVTSVKSEKHVRPL